MRPALRMVTAGENGEPMMFTMPVNGRDVIVQIWRIQIGRLNLYLLDHDHRHRWSMPNQPVTQPDQDNRSHGHPDGFLAPRKLHCLTPV